MCATFPMSLLSMDSSNFNKAGSIERCIVSGLNGSVSQIIIL